MIQLKIKLLSENSFLVFVIDKIPNIKNDQELSDYLKNVFEIIKEKNQFDIYGYYDVLIYKDINYGLIIKLDKEELEYFNCYNKQIEMKIVIAEEPNILYCIDNLKILKKIPKFKIYLYKDKLYLELMSKINYMLLGELLEYSEIIFENVKEIKNSGEKIEIKVI